MRWKGDRLGPLQTHHALCSPLSRLPAASSPKQPVKEGLGSGASPRGGRVITTQRDQSSSGPGQGAPARSGAALLRDGGMWAGRQVRVSDVAGVWALVLNGSWVHVEWMRQRCPLALTALCHLKSEDNAKWPPFTGPQRRKRGNRYRRTIIWKNNIQVSSCTSGI